MGRPLPTNLATVDASPDSQDEETVILGMPGPWAEDNQEVSDHYTSKVGGLPDWPNSADEVDSNLLKCSVCGGELGLVAQVYAPLTISGTKIEERTLYVFGCPTASCGISPLSWRTLRLQKDGPSSPESSRGEPSSTDDGDTSSARDDPNSHDWWDDDSSWAPITQVENAEEIGALGLQELEAALLEAGYAAAERPQSQAQSQNSTQNHEVPEPTEIEDEEEEEDATTSGEITDADNPVLPCFYIYSQNEAHPCRGSRAVSALQNSERLVDFGISRGSEGDECWEGEEYEHDAGDRTYLKFKKRLDCYPEQCYRYCFGGRPLLANKDQGDPGICSLCRGPRIYEMQLMPPLLYYLQQACKDMPSASTGPNDWEWLTVIIYTCARSCSRPSPVGVQIGPSERKHWFVAEETTILQYET